jgi:hypothetical protein
MRLLTKKSLACTSSERWKECYYINDDRKWVKSGISNLNTKDVYKLLQNLGDNPDPDEVNKITQTTMWTDTPVCNECNTIGHKVIIEIGQTPYHDSMTAWICGDCFKKIHRELITEGECVMKKEFWEFRSDMNMVINHRCISSPSIISVPLKYGTEYIYLRTTEPFASMIAYAGGVDVISEGYWTELTDKNVKVFFKDTEELISLYHPI